MQYDQDFSILRYYKILEQNERKVGGEKTIQDLMSNPLLIWVLLVCLLFTRSPGKGRNVGSTNSVKSLF